MSVRNPHKTAIRSRLGKWQMRSGSKPIRTWGYLRDCDVAFVYVGVSKRGEVKVGMSENPDRRCASLGVRLHYQHPVLPSAAKVVETRALAILGNRLGDGEWVLSSPGKAEAAVRAAYLEISRFRRASPYLTEDEARRERISLAMDSEAV